MKRWLLFPPLHFGTLLNSITKGCKKGTPWEQRKLEPCSYHTLLTYSTVSLHYDNPLLNYCVDRIKEHMPGTCTMITLHCIDRLKEHMSGTWAGQSPSATGHQRNRRGEMGRAVSEWAVMDCGSTMTAARSCPMCAPLSTVCSSSFFACCTCMSVFILLVDCA